MKQVELLALLLALNLVTAGASFKADVQKLARMNFMELCTEFNHTCAEYEVITEDGYILTIHRIIRENAPPVLLWHGILHSSDTFILRGANSTGMALSDAGYDVWLGNSRGTRYSRSHISLDPDKDKKKFWNFSVHEMGLYDLSATIDFILKKTDRKKLSAIGQSRGTTMFYILASLRPAYNEKIQLFISLAPIAFITNIKPVLKYVINLWPIISEVLEMTETYELLPYGSAGSKIVQSICSQETFTPLCIENLMMSFAGSDPDEIEPDFYEVILGHYPAGESTKDLNHYVQIHDNDRFAQYDYGMAENSRIYGRVSPPDYDLKKVSTPVALLCGANDNVAILEDVDRLRKELPNVVYYKIMDRKEFNHMDFVWAKNVNTYVNPLLKDLLNKYA